MVSIRAFVAIIRERHFTFDHDFRFSRDFQRLAHAIGKLDALAAQQAGELIFGKRVGYGCHRGEDRSRIGADDGCGWKGRVFSFAQRA